MNTDPKNKNPIPERAPSQPEPVKPDTNTQGKPRAASLYDRMTARIVALLEAGTVPWRQPWLAQTGFPRNYATRKPYRGVNVFLLALMHYENPYWLTFQQALQLGGNVRKGEKSCPVVFWKKTTVEDEETGKPRELPLLRCYHVFNLSQCEGIGAPPWASSGGPAPKEHYPSADIVAGMPLRPEIRHGFTHASYSLTRDHIQMPARERFEAEEEYYSTLFHELTHATGHASRLGRLRGVAPADLGFDSYSKEELVAEMGAAFLCAHAGISRRTLDNSAAYLKGWLDRLRGDSRLVVQAAAQAQRAADFVLGVAPASNEH